MVYLFASTLKKLRSLTLYAKLVAENIAHQLERRMSFRRAIKSTAAATMRAGAKGVRIEVAGRLNGAEMSRREKEVAGSVPLHTLRADIDYAQVNAQTVAGIIGVKVWIYKGEVQYMLMPKRQKHRKVRKGKIRGVATSGNYIALVTMPCKPKARTVLRPARLKRPGRL
jgi:ribosomal protein S3